MKKRILSVLIALVMVIGLVPAVALTVSATTHVAEVNGTPYEKIEDALAAAEALENSTLTLLADFSTDVYLAVAGGKFTIDLAGKTWESTIFTCYLENDADVKIIDTVGGGVMRATDNGYPVIRITDTVKLEIAGGTIEHTATCSVIDLADYGNVT